MTQLTKQKNGALSYEDKKQLEQRLLDFVANLNQAPSKSDIKVNKFANNSKFLPIQKVEAKLNYYFRGLWETVNFKYQVVVNEIVGDLELRVFHPEAHMWLTRSGCGAVMIQQRQDSEITDISAKIKNTLTKDIGHLKAECIKNAAKSLGVSFGSNLNREVEDGLGSIDELEDILSQINGCKTVKELSLLYGKIPSVAHTDKKIKKAFTEKKIELSA